MSCVDTLIMWIEILSSLFAPAKKKNVSTLVFIRDRLLAYILFLDFPYVYFQNPGLLK